MIVYNILISTNQQSPLTSTHWAYKMYTSNDLGNLGPDLRQTRTLGRAKPAYGYPVYNVLMPTSEQ